MEGSQRRRLAVFSHPNHELAVFGSVQRLRPQILFLTDGGGEERVAQTRQGLESIGLLENAEFLNHREDALYDALLDGSSTFYNELSGQVRQAVERVQPEEVWCDAVEFYNPVHDIALPVVRAALNGAGETELYEVPLVYQREVEGEQYQVQRFPDEQGRRQERLELEERELASKRNAREKIYTLLRDQMGPVICDLPDSHLGVEVRGQAEADLPTPGGGRVLRYEWRGDLLHQRGEIERVIRYADHYRPVVSSLLAS